MEMFLFLLKNALAFTQVLVHFFARECYLLNLKYTLSYISSGLLLYRVSFRVLWAEFPFATMHNILLDTLPIHLVCERRLYASLISSPLRCLSNEFATFGLTLFLPVL